LSILYCLVLYCTVLHAWRINFVIISLSLCLINFCPATTNVLRNYWGIHEWIAYHEYTHLSLPTADLIVHNSSISVDQHCLIHGCSTIVQRLLTTGVVRLNCRYFSLVFTLLVFHSDVTGFNLLRNVFYCCVFFVYSSLFFFVCLSLCMVLWALLSEL